MNNRKNTVTILMAEDDLDDRLLIEEALVESQVVNPIRFVENGEELLDYLNRRGQYRNRRRFPRPGIILLDLKMPKKDGREALREIKADPKLRQIPVVVLTTSSAEEEIVHTYDLGANSFIAKPVTFEGLIKAMKSLGHYWLETVELP